MGGIPDLVKWSLSVVLTPDGWVGRVDNHQTKKTKHLAVAPQSPVRALIHQLQAAQLVEEDGTKKIAHVLDWLDETERKSPLTGWTNSASPEKNFRQFSRKNMDHTRHMAIYQAHNLWVTLIGAGGIGSTTGVCLGKMGVRGITVFDNDKVDEVNLVHPVTRHWSGRHE